MNEDRDGRSESGQTEWVCHVQRPGEAPQDLITLLPPEDIFIHGIIPEVIVGVLEQPLGEGGAIEPGNFARNKVFNDFLHEFIAIHAPELDGLQAEARRQGDGWVYLIDARTSDPRGSVPPCDIIGAFEVRKGRLVADSYVRNQNHVILTEGGFFRLSPELYERLSAELFARMISR